MTTYAEKIEEHDRIKARLETIKRQTHERVKDMRQKHVHVHERNGQPSVTAPPVAKRRVNVKKKPQRLETPRVLSDSIDHEFRKTIYDNEIGELGFTGFQVAIVQQIEKAGEITVSELIDKLWTPGEIKQARKDAENPRDLPRTLRNAIRGPKEAGLIVGTGKGRYAFAEWKPKPPRKSRKES